MRTGLRIVVISMYLGAHLLAGSAYSFEESDNGLEPGITLLHEGKLSEAKQFFTEKWKESEKSNADAAYYLGRVYYNYDLYDKAINYIEKAIELNDSVSDYHLYLGRSFGIKAMKANILKKASLAKKVKREFLRAVELDSTSVWAHNDLIQYYVMAPGIMGGSIERAIEHAHVLRNLDEKMGISAFGYIYNHEKRYDDVLELYNSAIEKSPDEIDYYFQLAETYDKIGEREKCIQVSEQVMEKMPDYSSDVLYYLAMKYQAWEEYDNAFEALEQMIEINPDDLRPYYQFGRTAIFSGQQLERAVEYYTHYLQHTPPKNQPSHSYARWRLGLVLEKLGELDKAKNEFEMAINLDSKNEEAQKALKDLKKKM